MLFLLDVGSESRLGVESRKNQSCACKSMKKAFNFVFSIHVFFYYYLALLLDLCVFNKLQGKLKMGVNGVTEDSRTRRNGKGFCSFIN